MQLIHGDVHLANVVQTPARQPAYLDFGSMGRAPRVHDLAYALAHLALAIGGQHGTAPEQFPWHEVPHLLDAYESAAGSRLTDLERQALAPYTAAIPLQYAARAAFFAEPAPILESNRPSLRLSNWLLTNPDMPPTIRCR